MIKRLDESYYDELYLLEEEIFLYHQRMRPSSFKEIPFSKKIYHDLICNENYFIFGYFIRQKIVGVIYVNKRDDMFYIDDICVSKNYRNQNIGSQLLAYVEKLARDTNIKRIELDVWSFNETAINFYQKNKFTPKTIRYEKIL